MRSSVRNSSAKALGWFLSTVEAIASVPPVRYALAYATIWSLISAVTRAIASGAFQSTSFARRSRLAVPSFTSHDPTLHRLSASTSASGQVSPFRSSSRGGWEKWPISGICGTLRNEGKSASFCCSVAGVPVILTTPNAAISGLSGEGSSLVTTSPLSMAANWASVRPITFLRNGRGGGSWADDTAALDMERDNRSARLRPIDID